LILFSGAEFEIRPHYTPTDRDGFKTRPNNTDYFQSLR